MDLKMAKHGHNGQNGHKVHVTETPDVSHIKNPDVTHETSDVNVGGILKFVIGLTIFGIIVNVLMWGMFRVFNAQETTKEPPKGPMAMTQEERLPPEPRLQAAPGFEVRLANGQKVKLENSAPEAEYRVLREQWEQQLNCRKRKAEHGGGLATADHPVCLPIEAALDKLFEGGGLPVRAPAKDSGWAESSLPTAASSGRVAGMK
jgi:hypothetical protein